MINPLSINPLTLPKRAFGDAIASQSHTKPETFAMTAHQPKFRSAQTAAPTFMSVIQCSDCFYC
jgi:hypothetical protein